jgi:hypothetical protein
MTPRRIRAQNIPLTPIGSDRDEVCRYCRAGSVSHFNWASAKSLPPESRPLLLSFVPLLPLRRGTLYRCKHCDQRWYLDEESRGMHRVPPDRMPLLEAWGSRPIELSSENLAELTKIGRTPPYWGGPGDPLYPCAVETVAGEHFDRAIVSFQRHAPLESSRSYRLGSEIARVRPSPHAAPLAVRVEASRADMVFRDVRQTVFEAPDGSTIHLDEETLNFKVGPVGDRITYFVVDAEQAPVSPGDWVAPSPTTA